MKKISASLRSLRALRQAGRFKTSVIFAAALCALTPGWADAPARSFTEMVDKVALVPVGTYDSEMLAKVTVAVDFIKRLELPKAQLAVNEALQLDPRNSQLHFLNGFVYQLQARQGDTQKGELALEGYQQALRIDPNNWIAAEFMGLAYMDLQQFDRARLAFSDALQLTPDSAVSVYGLMVASYLTGDARTACAMADQFQKTSALPNRGFVRSSVSVYASCGDFAQAERMRAQLSQLGSVAGDLERVDRRLAQWKAFYRKQEQEQARMLPASLNAAATPAALADERPMQLAQAFTTLPGSVKSMPSSMVPSPEAIPATPSPAALIPAGAGTPAAAAAATATASLTPPGALPVVSGPRMILVDVVLLSTQELASTSKGVNLLSALTLQLGSVSGNVAAFSRVVTSTVTEAGATGSKAITRAVTIPALSYSLNIANANNSINEVLARPTLAAIEGMPSEFFSGTNLSAGVVSLSSAGGTTVVPVEKRFGIKLAVTPTFLPQGRVQLKVDAQRTSLNATSENTRVAYNIEIAETTANANVVMNLGDTLVLSGLSEKVATSTRDGVPGLQDMPGVQYLFSNQQKTQLQRSVLILVTPRAPQQVAEAPVSADDSMAGRMKDLREKFGFTQAVAPNVESAMTHLQANDFFREFRQVDVTMERWDRMRSTGDRLREALGFLYY